MKCWQYTTRSCIRALPPYTQVIKREHKTYQIVPDITALQNDLDEDYVKLLAEVDATNYRGLVADINDHGNISLYYRFKNGKLREVWSVV